MVVSIRNFNPIKKKKKKKKLDLFIESCFKVSLTQLTDEVRKNGRLSEYLPSAKLDRLSSDLHL